MDSSLAARYLVSPAQEIQEGPPPRAPVRFFVRFDSNPPSEALLSDAPHHRQNGQEDLAAAPITSKGSVAPSALESPYCPAVHQDEEVLIPVHKHLALVTVGALTEEFSRRVGAKYPSLLKQVSVSHFIVYQEGPSIDLPPLLEIEENEQDKWKKHSSHSCQPCAAPIEEPEEEKSSFFTIDAVMNRDDRLSEFFSPPSEYGEVKTYTIVAEWGPPLVPKGEILETLETVDTVASKVPSMERLSDCLRLSETRLAAKKRHDNLFPPPPCIMVTQRSTYLDLLEHRRGRQLRHTLVPTVPIVDPASSQDYIDRQSLAEAECKARAYIEFEETRECERMISMVEEEAEHLFTLACLKGNAMENGVWLQVLGRNRRYPFDTVPLVPKPKEEELIYRHQKGDETAETVFHFRHMEEYLKRRKLVEEEERKRLEYESQDHYRDDLLDLVLEEKKAERNHLDEERHKEFYLEQGFTLENIPPKPSTPPSPFIPRTPDLDDLGAAYDELLDHYLEWRHEILAWERKDFGEMVTLMRAVIAFQKESDVAAVRLAYSEELNATGALSFDTYVHYDPEMLQEEMPLTDGDLRLVSKSPQVIETPHDSKVEPVAGQPHTQEALDDRICCTAPPVSISVNANPFLPPESDEKNGPLRIVSDAISAIDQGAGLLLEMKLGSIRLSYRESTARNKVLEEESEAWRELKSFLDA